MSRLLLTKRSRIARSALATRAHLSEDFITELATAQQRRHLSLARSADIHHTYEGHWAAFQSGRGRRQAHMRLPRQGFKVGAFRTTRQLSLFRSKAQKKKADKAKKTKKPRVVRRGRQKGPAMDLSVGTYELTRRGGIRQLETRALANLKKRLGV